MTPYVATPIGSNTKFFTAVALWQLAEKGLIDKDAPVSEVRVWVAGGWVGGGQAAVVSGRRQAESAGRAARSAGHPAGLGRQRQGWVEALQDLSVCALDQPPPLL